MNSVNKRPTLGVVAICKNEEQDLPGFLDCLLPWIDELVLVDDGSSDRTAIIAKNAGNKVKFIISKRLKNEFYADQRNKGIDAAESDWLLHMDVDERVTAQLENEILLAIRNNAFDGYHFRRINYFLHRPMRGGGWQNWNLIHLARRDLFRFGGMFHESCHLDAANDRIGQLQEPMIHFNDASLEERFSKSMTYQKEVSLEAILKSKKVTMLSMTGCIVKEFMKKYFLQKGFIDGTPGLISAMHSSTAVFRTQALMWEAQNQIAREDLEQKIREESTHLNKE
jgi:glycosyltransferase involved in cell wall biosynthesis